MEEELMGEQARPGRVSGIIPGLIVGCSVGCASPGNPGIIVSCSSIYMTATIGCGSEWQ